MLAIWQKALGESHPDVVLTIEELADVSELRGKHEAAQSILLTISVLRAARVGGARHP